MLILAEVAVVRDRYSLGYSALAALPNQHTNAGIDVAFSGRTARRYLSTYSSICLLKNALYLDDIMR